MYAEARVRERLLAGDTAGAATEAIRGLGPKVVGYLRTMFPDAADVSDGFGLWTENLWKGIGAFEGRSSFRTWALRLAWNAALTLRDQAHRRHERRLVTGESSALAAEVFSRSYLQLEQRREQLLELRRLLTDEERTLLFLRVDQGLRWADVGEILSAEGSPVSAEAASKRFERLRVRLEDLARRHGMMK